METVERVLALLRSLPDDGGRPLVLGIDGRSGAGKTDLAAALVRAVPQARVLALEDAYRGWDGLRAGVEAVADGVLAPLRRGEPGRYRRYDWHAGVLGEEVVVPVPPLLVLEGCGAGAAPCAPYLDALVWVEAPADLRRRRVGGRDGYDWSAHWETWARQEEELLAERDARTAADLVVPT
ncbi:hypothetical protein [Georgenia wangjunii]|uniref:hypothetical protein n=1 Tax=Georgenia wangjunii TaxID=3117730 RepID=UPI002F25F478